jgi:hypothetical protein
MKNLFKVYLKKIFSDLHSAILGIIVAALILGAGGIWVFSKDLCGKGDVRAESA